ncbi:hypothetical protein J2Z21_000672 [Streptomyces griseochromogenes]|uniref:DUF8017 domain-containing protein n=1 Tax=Streptomyces griseochromogenes TaxID=68214 RepID=A0A1B1B2M2_9ACTN|nr:hypothetical protein [Streptomyces griseochromogenes]ANP53067.1 hypothetical protein AVL59_29140 [Streptomyces griseochromogenes]MBP2047750.1 hypothetical protein [Streptomyces griseochromogenes]
MWPGEQSSGGGQNPQQPPVGHQSNGYQQPGPGQPNPYQQPGPGPFQQNPYQQPQHWQMPAQPTAGAPVPPPAGGGRNRTGLVAAIAAAAVVLASGVTAFLVLGDHKHDEPGPKPTNTASPSRSSANPRGADTQTATIKGWKVVTNPTQGIAFDVPPQWEIQSADWVSYVSKDGDPDDKPLIAIRNVAMLQKKWCSSDENRDGTLENVPLAQVGTRGNHGYRSTQEIAGSDPKTWVYGGYTQPDKTKVKTSTVEAFTTSSGLKGTLGTAWSVGVKKTKKCTTDGKAWTFAFKNTAGNLVSWSFFGAKNVSDEVSDTTIRKVAATVRLYKAPPGS